MIMTPRRRSDVPARAPVEPRTGPRSPAVRRVAVAAFVVYLLVLVGVAFLPLPGAPRPGTVGVVPYDLRLSRPDLLGSWETERNVLMTVPFGVLLPLVVRWRYELMVLACVALTLVIETGQLLGSLIVGWAWRAFDVNDLFNNTVGGLLGLAVTGTVLAVVRRPARLPARRLVPGALAAALVAGAALTTATAPTGSPVYACDERPTRGVTALPGEASAYAGEGGSLCLRTPSSSDSLPRGAEPGPLGAYDVGGQAFQVGIAPPGAEPATDGRGTPVESFPVQGSHLRVWVEPVPQEAPPVASR